jgi:hypothetical protein
MTNLRWSYVDPLAMRNIEAERREFELEPLQARLSKPAATGRSGSIQWWVIKYEDAGRALMRDAKHDRGSAGA